MSVDKLPHGPWKPVFTGEWEGHKVDFVQNKDKATATLIHAEGGQVVIVNKYFVFEKGQAKLIKKLDCHAQVIEKYYPTFRGKYFVVSSGPDFYPDADLEKNFKKDYKVVDNASEIVRRFSEDEGIEFKALAKADAKFAEQLFSDPLSLIAVTSKGGGVSAEKGAIRESIAEVEKGQLVLGKTIAGEDVIEEIQVLKSIVIKGKTDEQINALKVIAENAISNDMNAIIFDEENYFEKMSYPNQDMNAFDEYTNLQPVGMPMKTPTLETIPITLKIINGKMIGEILGFSEGADKPIGWEAIDIIGRSLENYRGKIEWLDDLIDLLQRNMDDVKKFETYRAIRMLRMLKIIAGAFIGGMIEIKNLTSGKLNKMGVITRIDLQGLPENIKKLFILSITYALNSHPAKKLKNELFIPEGQKYLNKDAKSEIGKKLFEEFEKTNDNGTGFCVGTDVITNLHGDIVKNAEMTFDFISKKEAAVKGKGKKSYRLKLRPSLSG